MAVTYHPNKYESYPVEILRVEPEKFRVRVRVTDGRKPFPQSGFFAETSYSDTGWVSAAKCVTHDEPTVGELTDSTYGQLSENLGTRFMVSGGEVTELDNHLESNYNESNGGDDLIF